MDKSNQVVSIYNAIADSYADTLTQPTKYLEEFINLLPSKANVLDAGCGVGVDAGVMLSHGFRVRGIDLSGKMLQIARNRFPEADFRQEDIRKIDFPPDSFDGILASFSLIHIPKKDIPGVLNRFYDFLKDHGVIYISIRSGRSEEVYVDEPFKPGEKIFVNIMSMDEIHKLLENSGFTILKMYKKNPEKINGVFNYAKLYLMAHKS